MEVVAFVSEKIKSLLDQESTDAKRQLHFSRKWDFINAVIVLKHSVHAACVIFDVNHTHTQMPLFPQADKQLFSQQMKSVENLRKK